MSDLKNVMPVEDFDWESFENGSTDAVVSKEELEKTVSSLLVNSATIQT